MFYKNHKNQIFILSPLFYFSGRVQETWGRQHNRWDSSTEDTVKHPTIQRPSASSCIFQQVANFTPYFLFGIFLVETVHKNFEMSIKTNSNAFQFQLGFMLKAFGLFLVFSNQSKLQNKVQSPMFKCLQTNDQHF